MCTSVLFNFSNLLDHVDVQPHTLYKIDRYRAELHREAHIFVEAAKKIDILPYTTLWFRKAL